MLNKIVSISQNQMQSLSKVFQINRSRFRLIIKFFVTKIIKMYLFINLFNFSF